MLHVLESSAKVFSGLQQMNNFMQAVNTIMLQPTKASQNPKFVAELLQACEISQQWINNVSEHAQLLKQPSEPDYQDEEVVIC